MMNDEGSDGVDVKIVPAYDHPQEVKALFGEYTAMLVEGDPGFQEYLDLQNYDEETEHLEAKYGRPYGRLYLAYIDGEPAGCIGLKKIDEESCEMKRLYVRPAFRSRGLGRILVQKIIDDGKEIGYQRMMLDTLPFLKSAVRLYREFGFYEIKRYNDSPMDTSIFMELNLEG